MIERGINIQGVYGRCALSAAAIARQWEIVAQLLDQGATLSQGEEGEWAFQAAVDNGQWEVIKKSSTTSKYGRTALQAAAEKGQLEIVGKLLEAGVRLEEKGGWSKETVGSAALPY
ncbi:MAG: ankyrin repeat domain-containing protein [Bacteroidota bacterium]